MNRTDDIERVLEQWFTEGPRHMSDRLFDGTLDRIDGLPKRRLADLSRRFPAMNRYTRLAVAAALIVALTGAGLAILNRLPDVGAVPSPAALQSFWKAVGDRVSPGDWGPDDDSMNIDSTGLRIEQLHGDVLSSMSIADGGSQLVLRFEHGVAPGYKIPFNQEWTCAIGTEGTYSMRLSPDGGTLTLGLISDTCVPRAVFLAGDWTRAICPQGYYACATAAPASTPPSSFAPSEMRDGLPSASDLRGYWTVTAPRPINDGSDTAEWGMVIDPATFVVGRTGHTTSGAWFIHEAGILSVDLWSRPGNWGCEVGAKGLYDVTLSSGILTIAPRSDQCSIRAVMLAGDWRRTPPFELAATNAGTP